MNEQPHPRRATLLVVGVFLVGLALGVVGSYAVMKRTFAATQERAPEPARRARLLERMTNEISLTAEQSKDIDKILEELQERFKAIHDREGRERQTARREARDKMRVILRPDQTPKFEEFFRRLDEERAKKTGH
jgi:hypothetical protein